MKTIPAAIFLSISIFSAAFAKESSLSVGDRGIQEKIRQAMEGVETLSGDFIEEKRILMLKEPAILNGRFFYSKPDRLRWEYLAPEKQGFAVSSGKGLRWRGEALQATAFDLDAETGLRRFVEQVFAWIRADFEQIREGYRISFSSKEPVSLTLTPLSGGADVFLDRIQIIFSADLRHIQTVEIHEKDGDASRIRFANIRINMPVDQGIFP